MNRFALSLSLLLTMAPTAQAEGNRSLGVTVSPVGAFVLGTTARGVAKGYSANVGWTFNEADSLASLAGHVSASALYTAATPLSVQLTPMRRYWIHPYAGLGPTYRHRRIP